MASEGWHGSLFVYWTGQNDLSGVQRDHHRYSNDRSRQRSGKPLMVAEIGIVIFVFETALRCVMVAETEVSSSGSSERVRVFRFGS